MNPASNYTISPLGDSALLVSFGNVIDESVNDKVLALFERLKSHPLKGVHDVVPAYSSLGLHYDIMMVNQNDDENISAYKKISRQVEELLSNELKIPTAASRVIKIPVCYSTEAGIDLQEIAVQKNLTINEIIRIHTSKIYKVYMIGFLPGFAYMGEVDDRIAIPRKAQPRQKVDGGSVGIAGKQTGVYPLTSPGGWQIIGKTPLVLFEKEKERPVLFQPGDQVQFYSITQDEFNSYQGGDI